MKQDRLPNGTGITERLSDSLQPYRVWYRGNIIWFARTKQEAETKLAEAEAGHQAMVKEVLK